MQYGQDLNAIGVLSEIDHIRKPRELGEPDVLINRRGKGRSRLESVQGSL